MLSLLNFEDPAPVSLEKKFLNCFLCFQITLWNLKATVTETYPGTKVSGQQAWENFFYTLRQLLIAITCVHVSVISRLRRCWVNSVDAQAKCCPISAKRHELKDGWMDRSTDRWTKSFKKYHYMYVYEKSVASRDQVSTQRKWQKKKERQNLRLYFVCCDKNDQCVQWETCFVLVVSVFFLR